MAARRVPLVFRFWHFHIHRASVLFDLAAEVAAEGDRIQERAARVFKCFLQVQSRRTRRDSLPSARLAQALRGRFQPDTKTDLLLVPARAVMTGESVRPLVSNPIEAEGPRAFLRSKFEMWGCKQPRVSTICKSWSYKPLAFQRFRLRGRPGEAATSLGMIVKNARYSSPLKGRSGARVVWQGRPSDRPNAIAPHWAGRSIRTR
jgi:hypothetical protein